MAFAKYPLLASAYDQVVALPGGVDVNLQVVLDAFEEAQLLRDTLATSGATLNVEVIEAEVARVRLLLETSVTLLRATAALGAVELRHPVSAALIAIAGGLERMAEALVEGRARIIDYAMPSFGNAALAAFLLYGDISRRRELIELNKIFDPNRIPAGTVLRVRER